MDQGPDLVSELHIYVGDRDSFHHVRQIVTPGKLFISSILT